jgi:hypothetical protein
MNKMIKNILLVMLLISSNFVFAQDSLKTNVFNVDKVLKPILSESMKIQSNPNPEVPEIKTPVFEYANIPDTIHKATSTIYTIKPLSMGTSLLPKLKNNYTKFGYGNLNTPLFEVYLNTVRNKEWQAGIFAKHLSSNPSGYNTFSNNVIEGFAKKFSSTSVLDLDVNYCRKNAYLYGFQPENPSPNSSDIQQLFQTIEAKGSFSNIVKDSVSMLYKIGAGFYNFSDSHGISENDFKVFGDFKKLIDNNPLEVKTQLNITDVKNSTTDYQRVYFDLNPRYTLKMDELYLRLGFNSTFYSDSSNSNLFFFPVAEAGYSLITKSLIGFAGITGDVKRNTYRSIINQNPFVRDLDFKNTVNNFELYGGFKGQLGAQTSFSLQASWKSVQNQLFYAIDSAKYNSQMVYYDTKSISIVNLKGEISHEFADQFRMSLTANYYNYSTTISHPYALPTFETKLNLMYNIGDKFILKADIFTMNQRYALVMGTNGNTDVTLKGLVDLNAGIDYRYSKTVSVFLNLNNLTNNMYQRWYITYPSYGFNLIGGLAVTF